MFHDSFGHWHWHPAISNVAHGENLSALTPPRVYAARAPLPPPLRPHDVLCPNCGWLVRASSSSWTLRRATLLGTW